MDNPLSITPNFASSLLLSYRFFESHEKASLPVPGTTEVVSSIGFESFLKEIGRQAWGTEDLEEIVAHLEGTAEGVALDEAVVPVNITSLVKRHEEWEIEQAEAQRNPSAEQSATAQVKKAVFTRELENTLGAVQKVPETAAREEKPPTPAEPLPTATQEEKPAPATVDFKELARRGRIESLREAVVKVVGERAEDVARTLEAELAPIADRGAHIDSQGLNTLIKESLVEVLGKEAVGRINDERFDDIAEGVSKTQIGQRVLPASYEIPSRSTIRSRSTPPASTQPVVEPTNDTRALREAQLLLRVSYQRSVGRQVLAELLHALGGKAYANSHPLEAGVQSLLLQGVTIKLLREAITRFKEQNPGISPADPRVRTLEEIITAMEAYQTSHPGNYEKFELRAADKVEVYVATPGEEVPATPGKMLRLRSIFDATGEFQFLRIDTLSLKKGIRALPGIVGRAVSYPFLYAARIFFGRPAGGILHALGGPRAVAVREASFGVQKGLVNFARGAFRQLGSFVSDVFTRPTLGWLRWGLTGGFGLGAFTLPFPFNFLSGGLSGLTGATQLAHATSSAGSFLRGLARLRGGGGSGGRSRFALGSVPMILGILIIPVLAFMVITSAQGTFQGIGGGGIPTGGVGVTSIAKDFVPPPINPSDLTFYWPINPSSPKPSCYSGYGWRDNYFHNGIDISESGGIPVYPVADGKVYSMIRGDHIFGNVIVIGHAPGLFSLYAHLDGFSKDIDPNDPTKTSVVGGKTVLGGIDSGGSSTGNHLHLGMAESPELTERGKFLNSDKEAAFFPCDYLKQYCSRTPPCLGAGGKAVLETQPKSQPKPASQYEYEPE